MRRLKSAMKNLKDSPKASEYSTVIAAKKRKTKSPHIRGFAILLNKMDVNNYLQRNFSNASIDSKIQQNNVFNSNNSKFSMAKSQQSKTGIKVISGSASMRHTTSPNSSEALMNPPKRKKKGVISDFLSLSSVNARAILKDFGVPEKEINELSDAEAIEVAQTLSNEKTKANKNMCLSSYTISSPSTQHQERCKHIHQKSFDLPNCKASEEVVVTNNESFTEEMKAKGEEGIGQPGHNLKITLKLNHTEGGNYKQGKTVCKRKETNKYLRFKRFKDKKFINQPNCSRPVRMCRLNRNSVGRFSKSSDHNDLLSRNINKTGNKKSFNSTMTLKSGKNKNSSKQQTDAAKRNFEQESRQQLSMSSEQEQQTTACSEQSHTGAVITNSGYLSHQHDKITNRCGMGPLFKFNKFLQITLDEMHHSPDVRPFLFLINSKKFPDYYKVVKHPIDLQTIRNKACKKEYQSREQFLRDINQIVENTSLYNSVKSVSTVEAHSMYDHIQSFLIRHENMLIKMEEAIKNPPLYENDQISLSNIFQQIWNRRIKTMAEFQLFMKPIDWKLIGNCQNNDASTINIEKIEEKIKAHMYCTSTSFTADFNRLLVECIKYTGSKSVYTKKAKKLAKIVRKSINKKYALELSVFEASLAAVPQEKSVASSQMSTSVPNETGSSPVVSIAVFQQSSASNSEFISDSLSNIEKNDSTLNKDDVFFSNTIGHEFTVSESDNENHSVPHMSGESPVTLCDIGAQTEAPPDTRQHEARLKIASYNKDERSETSAPTRRLLKIVKVGTLGVARDTEQRTCKRKRSPVHATVAVSTCKWDERHLVDTSCTAHHDNQDNDDIDDDDDDEKLDIDDYAFLDKCDVTPSHGDNHLDDGADNIGEITLHALTRAASSRHRCRRACVTESSGPCGGTAGSGQCCWASGHRMRDNSSGLSGCLAGQNVSDNIPNEMEACVHLKIDTTQAMFRKMDNTKYVSACVNPQPITTQTILNSQPITTKTISNSQPITTQTILNSQLITTQTISNSQPITTQTILNSQPITTQTILNSQIITTQTVVNSQPSLMQAILNLQHSAAQTIVNSQLVRTQDLINIIRSTLTELSNIQLNIAQTILNLDSHLTQILNLNFNTAQTNQCLVYILTQLLLNVPANIIQNIFQLKSSAMQNLLNFQSNIASTILNSQLDTIKSLLGLLLNTAPTISNPQSMTTQTAFNSQANMAQYLLIPLVNTTKVVTKLQSSNINGLSAGICSSNGIQAGNTPFIDAESHLVSKPSYLLANYLTFNHNGTFNSCLSSNSVATLSYSQPPTIKVRSDLQQNNFDMLSDRHVNRIQTIPEVKYDNTSSTNCHQRSISSSALRPNRTQFVQNSQFITTQAAISSHSNTTNVLNTGVCSANIIQAGNKASRDTESDRVVSESCLLYDGSTLNRNHSLDSSLTFNSSALSSDIPRNMIKVRSDLQQNKFGILSGHHAGEVQTIAENEHSCGNIEVSSHAAVVSNMCNKQSSHISDRRLSMTNSLRQLKSNLSQPQIQLIDLEANSHNDSPNNLEGRNHIRAHTEKFLPIVCPQSDAYDDRVVFPDCTNSV